MPRVYRTTNVSVDCTVSVVGAALVYACRTAPGRVDDAWTPLQYARRMQWHTGQMTERGGAGQVDAEDVTQKEHACITTR
jgi:hypothetical protein